MRFLSEENFDDFHGLVSCSQDFVTLEPFLKKKSEYRLQKMGDILRCYSRESKTHEWKANVGEGEVNDMEVTERHHRIAEHISGLFPHFDIWGADFIVTEDGEEYCLELNDSSIGFIPNHQEEDQKALVNLVMKRLETEYHN